ncbi:hypothetical protein DIE20_11565 [Burkholderia sp. Bp9131]|uniref:hypothetical protein n=1 Tax=Burkholderia sp. Bp9131 TaxID=2184571 RepID=UPI000F559BE1|nr:hypothetical protein [Burkholderia sp. Bp9131]RQR43494.1 hypothetical protein DIE20_11565 [Burkholderia sp. Bp9131]
MKVTLTDRQKEIVRDLRLKDAGKNVLAFDSLESGEVSLSEIDLLCGLVNGEYMMEGILPNFEPNEYGVELEALLDVINRQRLNS